MALVEEDIIAAGAAIIWVLTETRDFDPGTAENCRTFVDSRGSDNGFCVGESEMMNQLSPGLRVFDTSSFALGRGFDLIVSRRDMVIRQTSNFGTPRGNDNLTGEELLALIQTVRDDL